MSFRKRLLLLFALTIALVVALSSTVVWVMLRRSFERANEDRAEALTAQFRSEFARRGEEVSRRVAAVAQGETANHIALEINRGNADYGSYVNEARALADAQHLDFLELIDSQGTILSSAQWPAKFGYKKTEPGWEAQGSTAFLKREELADGLVLGLFSMRTVRLGEKPLHVLGGQTLGSRFLESLDLPPGLRVLFYSNLESGFSAQRIQGANGAVKDGERLGPLIQRVQATGKETGAGVEWSSDSADADSFRAIPLKGANQELLGVLLVGSSRRPLVELQRHIVSATLLVGGVGLLLAILLSSWLAARVTHPMEELANAARRVAAGDWDTRVEVTSRDELGELASAFNRMTGELRSQRDHLVQAERVAAWRELARRLAHELMNPLFPLQVTVENLIRSRAHPAAEFEEVFQESTTTLLAELGNLKAIIGRFSEFSKMPQPQRQNVDVSEAVRAVVKLHQAQLQAPGKPGITVTTDLSAQLPRISADPELLHRALSNLILNAIDAMPAGGSLGLATRPAGDGVEIDMSDTGSGLSKEECERLFTPYYTTKQHGTGLGLAIVQSVVSDHGGEIGVESSGHGTTFRIRLPRVAPEDK
jgi:two-component system nitrogen regulation sensor histidine kinase NtrY